MWSSLLAGAVLGAMNLGHCAAMCGPLVANSCSRRGGAGLLRYQLGRTAAYAFTGAVCGHFGAGLGLWTTSAWSGLVFAALAAISCLLAARSVLRLGLIAPAAAGAATQASRLPASGLVRRSGERRGSWAGTLMALAPRDPLAHGLLSAFLPCGLLATAWLAAIATGSAPAGAALMLGFASASGLALLGTGLVAQHLPRAPHWLRNVAAGVLVASALLLIARPLAAVSGVIAQAPAERTHSCH